MKINNKELEMLDVFTEDNSEKIGIAERSVVHRCNLWHREVSCWIINEKNEVLLQRRSKNKKQDPNKIAITAGHIDAYEEPIDAVVREVEEEIGLHSIKKENMIFIDVFKAENTNNKHFKYVYAMKTNKKIEEMVMQESEVSELMYVSLDNLNEMMEKQSEEITFAKRYYTPIILNKIKENLDII